MAANERVKGQITTPNTEAPGQARGRSYNIPSSAHATGNHLFSKELQGIGMFLINLNSKTANINRKKLLGIYTNLYL